MNQVSYFWIVCRVTAVLFFSAITLFLSGCNSSDLSLDSSVDPIFSPTVRIFGYRENLNGQMSRDSAGSATIVSEDGNVLTSVNMVYDDLSKNPYDAFSICVSEKPDEERECRFTATLHRYDKEIGLALLSIDSEPIWGELPKSFPYLSHNHNHVLEEGDDVNIRWLPLAYDGRTVSITEGQVAEFDEINGNSYFKIDAEVGPGNSGGTILDEEDHFVGMPIYIEEESEDSIRAIGTDEIKKWIESDRGESFQLNASATEKVRSNLRYIHDFNRLGKILYDEELQLYADIPDGWELEQMQDSFFYLKSKDDLIQAIVFIEPGFSTIEAMADMSDGAFIYASQNSGSEIQEEGRNNVVVAGHEAIDVWKKTSDGIESHYVIFRHGQKNISITYAMAQPYDQAARRSVEEFVNSLYFYSDDTTDEEDLIQSVNIPDYPFTIELPETWELAIDHLSYYQLAVASPLGKEYDTMTISHDYALNEDLKLAIAEGQEWEREWLLERDVNVVFQSDELVIDGLPGWVLVYEIQIEVVPTTIFRLTFLDPHNNYLFEFYFEKNGLSDSIKDMVAILNTFKSKLYDSDFDPEWDERFDAENQGIYNIPLPF